MSPEDGAVQLPWRGGRHGWGAQAQPVTCTGVVPACAWVRVRGCVAFPHSDRGAAGMLLLCRLPPWERGSGVPLREGVTQAAGRVRLAHRGCWSRGRSGAQPGAGPHATPDDLAVPGSQREPAMLLLPRHPSVTWGHRSRNPPRSRAILEMVPVVTLVTPAGVGASPAHSGGPWHQVRLLGGRGAEWPVSPGSLGSLLGYTDDFRRVLCGSWARSCVLRP